MSQSRKGSVFEAVMNVLVGFSINFFANMCIFPFFGWQLSPDQNMKLGVIYTAISLVRSYCIRRWFNGFKARSQEVKP